MWTLVARLRRHLVLILTNRTKSKTNSAKQKPLNSSQMTPNAGLRLGRTKERSESRRRQWPTNQSRRNRRGRAIAPPYFYIWPFFNLGGYIMPTSLRNASLALLNFQTFLRPCNAKLKGLSTRLIGKTKNLLLRKLGQVARQFSRQNKFLYPSFYSQCFLIRRLINNSWLNERWILNIQTLEGK